LEWPNKAPISGRLFGEFVFPGAGGTGHVVEIKRGWRHETRLVEAFAGSAITLDNLNARTLLGEPISLAEYAQTVSAMVRVASRLGCSKRFRDVTPPDPLQYAAEHAA
jgi:hypothetical protein